jgi:hypothetical protein
MLTDMAGHKPRRIFAGADIFLINSAFPSTS